MKKIFLLFVALALTLSLCGCNKRNAPLSSTQVMMTTVVTVTLYDGEQEDLDIAMRLIKEYEKLFDRNNKDSDVYKLNNNLATTVSGDTAILLEKALSISEKSNGAFDISILPLVELWNITKATEPPKPEDIEAALKSVDFNNISINNNEVQLKNNCKIDLGGIAKGYIADKVKEHLKNAGVKNAVINLGGNIVVMGDNNGQGYSVGIQSPFKQTGELSARITISDMTAVTSGIYERYFEYENEIYHHILDSKTGHPVNNELASVTIIAKESAVADGLSTACLVLGIEQSKQLLKQYDAEAVFLKKDGSLSTTDNLIIDNSDNIPEIKRK